MDDGCQPEADMVRNDEVGKSGRTRYAVGKAALRTELPSGGHHVAKEDLANLLRSALSS